MPRLLLLLTGGTLLMTPTDPSTGKGGSISLDEERMIHDLVREVPSLGRVADFDTRLLFQMDSDHRVGISWWYAGLLHVLIRAGDLAARRFRRVHAGIYTS